MKVKALTGEVTDNIPKIMHGFEPKTALKMIRAGVDPSVNSRQAEVGLCGQQFMTLKPLWKQVQQNYTLARIVRASGDEHLPDSVRKQLAYWTMNLTQETFLREPAALSDESFSEFTNFLAEYELMDLWPSRRSLWMLP